MNYKRTVIIELENDWSRRLEYLIYENILSNEFSISAKACYDPQTNITTVEIVYKNGRWLKS